MNPRPHGYEPASVDDVDVESPSPNSVKYKRYSILSPVEWLNEMLTSTLSVILFVGIIVIFRYMDNKPLSVWGDGISLSTSISVLATSCSAALMHGVSEYISQLKWLHFRRGPQKLESFETFDGASRGPLGSLKFLSNSKESLNMASIGAFITICALSFAPLAQQGVKIGQRFVITPDNNATFGYAHTYDREVGKVLANSDVESIPQDPSMQSAVIQGLYDIDTPSTFSCPGACSWKGTYISLGFKSECKNVTQATLKSAHCAKSHSNPGLVLCNMTTPAGLNISTRHMMTDYATNYWMSASSTMDDTQIELPSNFPKIALFAIYRSTSDANFQSYDINITDCSLSLTAYKHTAAQANGSTFSFGETREVDFGVKNPWKLDGSVFTGQLYTNQSKAHGIPAFNISWADLKALQTFFQSKAIATEWVDGNWINVNFGLSAALTGDVDIGKRFEKMATSMTDYLRSGPNRKLAYGSKMESEAFVYIRWPWLIGPAAIELSALLFAVHTIYVNRRSRNVPLWKSSALAAIACNYETKTGLIRTEVKDIKELKEVAKKALVQLE